MRNFIWSLVALMLVACNDTDSDNFKKDSGSYAFKQSELVVDVTPDTESFRLEAYYLREPDPSLRGFISVHLNKLEELPYEDYVSYPIGPFWTEDEDGTMFTDVAIYPENIHEEVSLVLSVMCAYDNDEVGFDGNEPIRDINIRLRPVE